jgi:hypothetical protein
VTEHFLWAKLSINGLRALALQEKEVFTGWESPGTIQYFSQATADHHLLRGDEFDPDGALPSHAVSVDCADPARYRLPELTVAREYAVGWSDTDVNRHMNNTRYADLTCDALADRLTGHRIVDVQMHFAGETRLGDVVTLSVGEADAAYVQGSTLRGAAFTARVELVSDDGV